MRFLTAIFLTCLLSATAVIARDAGNVWTLQRCIQYATEHNITIRQDSLNARLARYTLTQSRLSQLPSANVSGNYGRSMGRSINPTTNQFEEQAYNFLGPSGNSSVLLFGWMQVRNTIERNRYSLQASLADLGQRRNDIALNVANGYLAVLNAKEQINISRNKVSLSEAQLQQTRAFAESGRLPELDVAQQESQLANDSATLISAIAAYNAAILDMKTLLNLDFAENMEIQAPVVETGAQLAMAGESAEAIFQVARTQFGSVQASRYRVQSAEHGLSAARAARYPQLNLSYQIGSNFASNYLDYQQTGRVVSLTPVGFTSGDSQLVYAPRYEVLTPAIPLERQLRNNLRQTVMLSLNIPLFNAWQSQFAVKQAKINYAQAQLTEFNAELTLRQSIYKAHNDAFSAVQQYNAAKRAADAAKRAADFAGQRFELGLTSTVDLLVIRNSEFAAASNLITARYNLIFRLKVLDYYMGRELKL